MATYLVTGAAGFIGSVLSKRLLEDGNTVVTIDNLSSGMKENIPEGVIFIEGNTFDSAVINRLYEYKFEAVYHLAGQSGGVTCWENPVYDLNSNVTSTLLLLDYCKKNDCRKFVYASSMSVYGDENPCPVREDDEIKPKSFYAVGKNASENYLRIYSKEYGIKCTALRFNNVYGPGQSLKFLNQGMVRIFLSYALRDRHIPVLGDKDRYRDFVYIDDVVNACIMSERGNELELYNVYTIATNRKTTCEELIELIKSNLPFDITVKYEGHTQGDQFGIFCSYEKIYKSLGWKPQMSLDDGIRIMVKWGLNQIDF